MSSSVQAKLRLPVDYTFVVLSALTAVYIGFYPPENSLSLSLVFIAFLLTLLALDIYAIRNDRPNLLRIVEWMVFGIGLLMWVVIWVNGDLPTILLPAVLTLAGVYLLAQYKLLLAYSIGSVCVLGLAWVFNADIDAAIVGRSMGSVIAVIALILYLHKHIELLEAAALKQLESDETLRAALDRLDEKNRLLNIEITKFDYLCDHRDIVYWRLDLNDWMLTYNRRFAQRWNLEIGGAIPYAQLRGLMHTSYTEIHDEAIDRVRRTKQPFSTQLKSPQGEQEGRWFELNYWPTLDEDNQVIAINLSNIESTELIVIQEQLKQRNVELELGRQREANMYAVIGHELRTPAAILKMQLEQERRGLGNIDRKLFESSVDQLLGVVDTLRTVSQPDKLSSNQLQPAVLGELLDNQLEIMRTLADLSNFKLSADISDLPHRPLMLMSGPLKQVISNLIKNAIVHSAGSEVRLSVAAHALNTKQWSILLCVDDNGRGIEEAEIERLFEPYERGEGSMTGTGLGLSVCRDIAELMGAELKYAASPMGGAQFSLEWEAELAPSDLDARVDDPLDELKVLRPLSVLLVEDDIGLLQMTASLLSAECGRLRIAKNGLQALSILDNASVDLVLTDIFMPQMNGIELVKQMRAQGHTQPVIGLTAATLGQETAELLEAGASVVLNKPVEARELAKVVQALKD